MRRSSVSGAVSLAAVVALAVPTAATAAPSVPLGPPPAESLGSSEREPITVTRDAHLPSAEAQDGIETGSETSTVAPGLRLTEFDRWEPDGWIRGDLLTADLGVSGLRADYLHPGAASEVAPLSEQVKRNGAVAGVNGDFFDIDETDAPLGVGIDDGALTQAPASGHNDVAAVGPNGVARLMQVFLDATVMLPDGATPATDLNMPTVSPNGIGIYTPFWGDAPRNGAVEGARRVIEVEIVGGVVRAVRESPAPGRTPADGVRLLGVDNGADALSTLAPGQRVDVRYRPRTEGDAPTTAVGGNKVLLRDGAVGDVDDTAVHPRTAAGFSADGTRMWLLTIDGRQADSRGMTERELAEHLRDLGADDAINLDGGGSSTLLARDQGGAPSVRNAPSDGAERPVPNGIGFTARPGSGRLTGIRVEPGAERVLSGLSRNVRAYGHDETGAPVPSDPQWTVEPHGAGQVREGVFHAGEPGPAEIVARDRGSRGEASLTVLGPPQRLSTDVSSLPLKGEGSAGRFTVFGHDAEGFRTWVEPSDVQVEYDEDLLRIAPAGHGFEVRALKPSGASVVTVRAGGVTTRLGVTVGSEPQVLTPLDGVGGWRAEVYPEQVTASLSEADGHAGTPGMALDYDFTGATVTRAAYATADPALTLPRGTQKIGAWVFGDGKNGWLRATVRDGVGISTTVDLARHVDWTGWRYVEGVLPDGVSGPLTLDRLYVAEPDAKRQYAGRLVFDDLTASVAPPVDVPVEPTPPDPAVVQDGTLPPEPGPTRLAVVSDAQFTADEPDGPLVQRARRSLREALRSEPDAVVINGDFVDRGTAADFDLARQVIDSELGGRVPWFYVPGNHEADGSGGMDEFTAEFGAAHQVTDLEGTRMVLLNSSAGSLSAGGFDQVRMLHDTLAQARTDPSVRSVAVFLHHPLDDPGPGEHSQLSDPKESALLARWLGEFERDSGKDAVLVSAHAGVFHASTVDGVQHLVNGNAGKAPADAPEDGGFTGTSLLELRPHEQDTVRWEVRPHVDELLLDVPENLSPGHPVEVRATLRQGGRDVPIGYPVGADWMASPNVHIGPPEGAEQHHVAALDPVRRTLTPLRAGEGTIGVTVHGVTKSARFRVL